MRILITVVLFSLLTHTGPLAAEDPGDALRQAARKGDRAKVQELLEAGVDVNAATEYGATALFYAADKGHLDVVKLLVEKGANVNARDSFYQADPLMWAAYNDRSAVAVYLVENGSISADGALTMAAGRSKLDTVQALLDTGKVSDAAKSATLVTAEKNEDKDLVQVLKAAGAKPLPKADATVGKATLERYVGKFVNPMGPAFTFSMSDEGKLQVSVMDQGPFELGALDERTFRMEARPDVKFEFEATEGSAPKLTLHQGEMKLPYQLESLPAGEETADEDEAQPPS